MRLVWAAACLLASVAMAQHHEHDKEKAHFEHKFDKPEEYAKRFDDPKRDAWQKPEAVIEELKLQPGMSMADIGAGTGYFSVRLAKRAGMGKVFAVDIEPTMVQYLEARKHREHTPNLMPVLASATSANIPEPVDVILTVDTYHHISDRVAYFRGLQKSLKPGGRLAIIDFTPESPEGPPKQHRFTAQQIKDEVQQAGYVLAVEPKVLPNQHFLIFRVK